MRMAMEEVCVVGLGYIGLPTASLLATRGFKVRGVDVADYVVQTINSGSVHIVEPDLDVLVRAAVQSGNLIAQKEPANSDVFIIAVPTPFKENHVPDLTYLVNAVTSIASFIKPGNLVILESTIPVGTTAAMENLIRKLRPDLAAGSFFMAHCPERVLPGNILTELVKNDRIVGGINEASAARAKEFYLKFIHGEIVETDSQSAELSKLTENAFRDVNIAFANELSLICDKMNINVWEVIRLANRHPRVKILNPGVGVGGHCIAVDPWFIVDGAPEQTRLIKTAREVNDQKPHHFIKKIEQAMAKFKQPTIAFLGLSYKPDIDDMRESPAVEVVQSIAKIEKAVVLVVEPHSEELPKALQSYSQIKKVNFAEGIENADIVVLLVGHKEFLNFKNQQKEKFAELLKTKKIIDTTGTWSE
jgi:UDP-N-acetyl-D-mannosaminuronic acid dehydrogenase